MPDWRLLMCHQGLFSIVQVVQPNGSTLLENKGRGKVGIAESTLWFASQKAVPDDIYESWNTEPVVVGSDSDADSCNFSVADTDIISISGTGSNSGNGSDIEDKLSSSMIDLELNDHAIRAVLLDRRKHAAKQQKTPPDNLAILCFMVSGAIATSSEKAEERLVKANTIISAI
ncbi:hypothetical protein EDD16DRAFT_1709070 [Pisolithus croceorrhizus]|nr:hypothetical protein EDD16DRAFT_1709070 [Pisolithus croceorrhizus]